MYKWYCYTALAKNWSACNSVMEFCEWLMKLCVKMFLKTPLSSPIMVCAKIYQYPCRCIYCLFKPTNRLVPATGFIKRQTQKDMDSFLLAEKQHKMCNTYVSSWCDGLKWVDLPKSTEHFLEVSHPTSGSRPSPFGFLTPVNCKFKPSWLGFLIINL